MSNAMSNLHYAAHSNAEIRMKSLIIADPTELLLRNASRSTKHPIEWSGAPLPIFCGTIAAGLSGLAASHPHLESVAISKSAFSATVMQGQTSSSG